VAYRKILLKDLFFTGPKAVETHLQLTPGLNVLYGASNTGKSFAVKTLDFLLGSSRPLPEIQERENFERAWLSMQMPQTGSITLMRALAGGALELHEGTATFVDDKKSNGRHLSARHDHTSTDNVSQFLLNELGFGSKSVAVDANGKKRSLSFRDIARFCIVDETAIQSESSPAESGQYPTVTTERSVFKLLTTGIDDSAIVPVMDRKSFTTSTNAKIEVVDEMVSSITEELTADHPNPEELSAQNERIEATWAAAQEQLQAAKNSIRSQLAIKRDIGFAISRYQRRREEIAITIGRFEQLEEVYDSDIERLEAIEETGFLLTLGGDKDCPLCGAPPDAQRHVHGLKDIERATDAAKMEIGKIARQRVDLSETLSNLNAEGKQTELKLEELDLALRAIELELDQLAPAADSAERRLSEILSVRDQIRRGLSLIEQRRTLLARRDELAALKPARKADKPRLGVPTTIAHDFAQTVSKVLGEWQFPGKRHVAFDEATYDLRIDGKNRRDNGKGVRAITHAAFKVALLIYCSERDLPHPGFVVLDTPLLTYRDPIHSSAGALTADEQAIANTSLKDFFFAHLSSLQKIGQFLVVENVDLPTAITGIANVVTFTGDRTSGRTGLFS
jgi:hypothetical protein